MWAIFTYIRLEDTAVTLFKNTNIIIALQPKIVLKIDYAIKYIKRTHIDLSACTS